MEACKMERTSCHLTQPPYSKQIQLDQITQGSVQLGFKSLQGRKFCNLSRQPVLVFDHCHSAFFSLYQVRISHIAVCVHSLLPFHCAPLRESIYHLLHLCIFWLSGCRLPWDLPLTSAFSGVINPALSPCALCHVFQLPDHFVTLPPDLLQFVNLFLVLRTQN